MSISINTRRAYSEIDEFLGLLNEEQRNKIPPKLREFFKEEKDKEYFKNIDTNIPIKEQNLKEETLAIIALLNLKYWCTNDEEKKRLKEIYSQNEKKYQNMLSEKYNSDNIFKRNTANKVEENIQTRKNMQIVEYKEPRFKKIINAILSFFHLR